MTMLDKLTIALLEGSREHPRNQVRAVLEALLEPTDAMVRAGYAETDRYKYASEIDLYATFEAMIQAALKD